MDSFQVIVNQWIKSMEKGLDNAKNEETKRIGKKIVDGFKDYLVDETIVEMIEKDRKDKISHLVNTLSEIALVESCISCGILEATESYNIKDLQKCLTDFIYLILFTF